jgi:hypothetical protein
MDEQLATLCNLDVFFAAGVSRSQGNQLSLQSPH